MDPIKPTEPTNSANSHQPINSVDLSTSLPEGVDREAEIAKTVVKKFQDMVDLNPGFRSGSALSPDKYMHAIEVTSWLQVPGILNRLQNEGVEKLRLIFPTPTPTPNSFVADENVADFIKEQHQISRFIKENHAKPIEEIKRLLAEKIEQSFSLGHLHSTLKLEHRVSASAWVEASLFASKTPKSLGVSTIAPIGKDPVTEPATSKSLLLELLESAKTERPTTVTVAGTDQQQLRDLATLLNQKINSGDLPLEHRNVLMSITKIWVGPYSPDINLATAAETPCPEVKEYSLREFLEKFLPKGDAPSAPGGTPPQSPTPPSSAGPAPSAAPTGAPTEATPPSTASAGSAPSEPVSPASQTPKEEAPSAPSEAPPQAPNPQSPTDPAQQKATNPAPSATPPGSPPVAAPASPASPGSAPSQPSAPPAPIKLPPPSRDRKTWQEVKAERTKSADPSPNLSAAPVTAAPTAAPTSAPTAAPEAAPATTPAAAPTTTAAAPTTATQNPFEDAALPARPKDTDKEEAEKARKALESKQRADQLAEEAERQNLSKAARLDSIDLSSTQLELGLNSPPAPHGPKNW